ncbi:choice-of-anchor J domain-containing protein [Salisaeta longa]|uniref:choice-of-anchor J domain-containing protein n=1 Tax=Salisaeta longa TaxID=503170 RepID=UPI0003B62C03|nr:choice-of-anchor J domain-containing protein [Salisaeta longa]
MPTTYKILASLVLFAGLVLTGCDSGTGVPDELGSNTTISFAQPQATVSEGAGAVTIEIGTNDPGYKPLSVEVAVSNQSTLSASEVQLPDSMTVRLPKSITSNGTVPFTFELVEDTEYLEGDETLVFELRNPNAGAALGETSTFTLTVQENDIPATMQEARAQAAGDEVVVDGIVTREDSDGFFLQDDTGALYVFDSEAKAAVAPGDRVLITGTTGYFSGLFQVSDVGTAGVRVLEQGVQLPATQSVSLGEITANGEQYESELVRVENFVIDDGGDNTFQGGSNYTVQDPSGSSTLRIPDGSALIGQSIPDGGTFTGVLSQFNFGFGGADEPDDGYQLLGLLASDLEGKSISQVNLVDVDFADGTLAPMTAYSVASNEDWFIDSFSGEPLSPYAKVSGFGADEASEDWLITPAFDLTGVEDETLTFQNAKNFGDSGTEQPLRVWVSTNYSGSGDPTTADWTDITDRVQNFSTGGYEFVSSGAIDLTDAEFQDASVHIAFQYRSSAPDSASLWQVDDIRVSGLQFGN